MSSSSSSSSSYSSQPSQSNKELLYSCNGSTNASSSDLLGMDQLLAATGCCVSPDDCVAGFDSGSPPGIEGSEGPVDLSTLDSISLFPLSENAAYVSEAEKSWPPEARAAASSDLITSTIEEEEKTSRQVRMSFETSYRVVAPSGYRVSQLRSLNSCSSSTPGPPVSLASCRRVVSQGASRLKPLSLASKPSGEIHGKIHSPSADLSQSHQPRRNDVFSRSSLCQGTPDASLIGTSEKGGGIELMKMQSGAGEQEELGFSGGGNSINQPIVRAENSNVFGTKKTPPNLDYYHSHCTVVTENNNNNNRITKIIQTLVG